MRYLVTGGSGYIGSRLVERLVERDETERVAIADVKPPRGYRPKAEYRGLDVRDAGRTRELLHSERPDALVHLAYVFYPTHDEAFAYDVDVTGTQNVLDAAAEADIEHVLVTSSAVAYGAFPDNPVPIEEDWPVRGVPDYPYARHKSESDRICQLWALQHPERTMTIVRPTIVFGPNVDNFVVRLWTKQPFQADLGHGDNPLQFVHEDDLVEALMLLLDGRHGGAFNVAADGTIAQNETADIIGVPRRRIPLPVFWRFAQLMWALRLSEVPPGQIHFARHPWVISNRKLKDATGWRPRYTTRETFEIAMRARGRLEAAPAPTEPPKTPAPVA